MRLIKEMRERKEINKIKGEREVARDTAEIQRII